MSEAPETSESLETRLTSRIDDLERRLAQAEFKLAELTGEDIPWTVLAAAVATVVDAPHHILAARKMAPSVNMWAFEGRRAIFLGRNFRRD